MQRPRGELVVEPRFQLADRRRVDMARKMQSPKAGGRLRCRPIMFGVAGACATADPWSIPDRCMPNTIRYRLAHIPQAQFQQKGMINGFLAA